MCVCWFDIYHQKLTCLLGQHVSLHTLDSSVHCLAQIDWAELQPTLVKWLGGGSFGQVFEAYWRSAPAAVKVIKLDTDDSSLQLTLFRFKYALELTPLRILSFVSTTMSWESHVTQIVVMTSAETPSFCTFLEIVQRANESTRWAIGQLSGLSNEGCMQGGGGPAAALEPAPQHRALSGSIILVCTQRPPRPCLHGRIPRTAGLALLPSAHIPCPLQYRPTSCMLARSEHIQEHLIYSFCL